MIGAAMQVAGAAALEELEALQAAKAEKRQLVGDALQTLRGLEHALANLKSCNCAFEAHVKCVIG